MCRVIYTNIHDVSGENLIQTLESWFMWRFRMVYSGLGIFTTHSSGMCLHCVVWGSHSHVLCVTASYSIFEFNATQGNESCMCSKVIDRRSRAHSAHTHSQITLLLHIYENYKCEKLHKYVSESWRHKHKVCMKRIFQSIEWNFHHVWHWYKWSPIKRMLFVSQIFRTNTNITQHTSGL